MKSNINEHGGCASCGGYFVRRAVYEEELVLEEDGSIYDIPDLDRVEVLEDPTCNSCGSGTVVDE